MAGPTLILHLLLELVHGIHQLHTQSLDRTLDALDVMRHVIQKNGDFLSKLVVTVERHIVVWEANPIFPSENPRQLDLRLVNLGKNTCMLFHKIDSILRYRYVVHEVDECVVEEDWVWNTLGNALENPWN